MPTLEQLDTPYERRRVIEYGVDGNKWSATGMMCSILPARFIKVKRKKISTGSRRWIFTFSSKGEKTDSCTSTE